MVEVVLRALAVGSRQRRARGAGPPEPPVKLLRDVKPEVLSIVRWKLEDAMRSNAPQVGSFRFTDLLDDASSARSSRSPIAWARACWPPPWPGSPKPIGRRFFAKLPPDQRALAAARRRGRGVPAPHREGRRSSCSRCTARWRTPRWACAAPACSASCAPASPSRPSSRSGWSNGTRASSASCSPAGCAKRRARPVKGDGGPAGHRRADRAARAEGHRRSPDAPAAADEGAAASVRRCCGLRQAPLPCRSLNRRCWSLPRRGGSTGSSPGSAAVRGAAPGSGSRAGARPAARSDGRPRGAARRRVRAPAWRPGPGPAASPTDSQVEGSGCCETGSRCPMTRLDDPAAQTLPVLGRAGHPPAKRCPAGEFEGAQHRASPLGGGQGARSWTHGWFALE